MDWNNIISFIAGGLIAIIPVIVANRFQAKEKDKDRHEQRKEAKTQLALELMRNDIKVVDNSIDNALGSMEIIADFSLKRWDKKLSVEDMKEQIKSVMFDEQSKLYQLGKADIGAEKIVSTLGDEIYSEYDRLSDLITKYWGLVVNNASVWDEVKALNKQADEHKLYLEVVSSAGKLHNMLNEKLISLRDN